MSIQTPETVFGFPVAPVLELAGALEQMRIASHGQIGGENSMVKNMMGLLPIAEQISDEEMTTMRTEAADFIPRMEPYVEILAGFNNPRKTFVKEIGWVAGAVLADAEATAVRSDNAEFGIGQVARGITAVFGDLIEYPEEGASSLPMLSSIVVARKRRPKPLKLPPALVLAPVVPEILTMLEAPLPKTRQHPKLVELLRRSPIVIAANLTLPQELAAFRQAAPVLLTSVRDLLPTEGSKVAEGFEEVKKALAA